MTLVRWMMVLLFGLFSMSCKSNVVADCEQKIQLVDKAINVAEDAWVKGSAQIRVLKTFIASADPAAQATKDAQAAQSTYETQIASYESVLDDLHAKRLELGWSLSYYKKTAQAQQFAVVVGQKITDYKSAYVAQIGGMSSQLKIVEDSIGAIQAIVADTTLTDTGVVFASNAQGKSLGALSGVDNALSALGDLDGKISSDVPNLQQMSPDLAGSFAAWWNQQKTWADQTRDAVTARRKMLVSLSDQMAQKKKDYDVAQAAQQQLTAAAADLQVKKTEALKVFQGLVQVRATLIQQMSDLANVIASALGTVDQTLAAVTQDADLAAALARAQSITNNMIDMGDLQRSFSSSEEILGQAMEGLKLYFTDQELMDLRASITQQSSWMAGFASALQAMRDQSGTVRTKLDAARTKLTTDTAAKQSAADYAASVQQLSQVITQVHNEASSLVSSVMMPLVLGASQKVMSLAGFFDSQPTTSNDLANMKNLTDEAVSDSKEIDSSIKEFNLWSSTLDQYGSLIQQQVADPALKKTLTSIQKDFVDWNIWIKAVSSRQTAMAATISNAQTKYNAFSDQLKVAMDAAYALDLSIKQLSSSLGSLDKEVKDVATAYQTANTSCSSLDAVSGADTLLAQITSLVALVVTAESDMTKSQGLLSDLVKTFKQSSNPKVIVDKYNKEVTDLQSRADDLAQKVKQARADTNALKDQAVAKKASLVAAAAAAATAASAAQAASAIAASSLSLTVTSSASGSLSMTTTTSNAAAASTGLLGAPAVTSLVADVKKSVDAVLSLKTLEAPFKGRFDGVKTADDLAAVTKDFGAARDQSTALGVAFVKLSADADAAQKLLDQDAAAGRNISNDVTQSLAEQRTSFAAAQKDLTAIIAALNTDTTSFNQLTSDFAKKKAALDGVTAAASDLAAKIQAIGGNLDKIKTAITTAQNTIASGSSSSSFDTAIAALADAEKLKATIANAKASEAAPAYDKLKGLSADYSKSFGSLPDELSTSISNQNAWLSALDSSLGSFMDSIGMLKTQLSTKRDQMAQNDVQALSKMAFSAQLKALEDAVPNVTQASQVESVMRNLDYAVNNRYGSQAEDKNPDMIVANKARLLRFIDWVIKNKRFATKTVTLSGYRKQVAG